MAEFDEKSLKAHIKSGDFLPLYLVYGDEDYLKKNYVDTIVSKNVEPSFESFNYEKYDGKGLELDTVFQAAAIMPMMSEKRCLVIEDFKLEGISEENFRLMENFFADPPETSIIIFYQKKPEFSVAKAKNAITLFKKFGAVCVLNKRSGNELIKPLITSASKQKCILTPQLANYLVSLCGDDNHMLINEVNKICNYVGEGEITKAHIDAIATKTDDAKIFALTKALMNKNFDEAYKNLHSLFRQKVEPEYILGVIISSYVDIYRAKVSLSCGQKADVLAGDFGYKNRAFALGNAGRDSSKIDMSVIRSCLHELSKADKQLKSGASMPALVLEQLMVKLFLITNGEKV
ncbi:MAG: DNA polymerase III subunit delta [Clostridia bacterium]|nr:DNA polymerase III subunit delta [Clostridia bacterium]